MRSLELTLLGNFQVHSASGTAINVPGKKVALLLAFLALPCGKAHSRDELIGLLWGTRDEQQARGSLRHALWTLRKCLGDIDPSPLIIDGDSIVLGADGSVEVDAQTFERLASETTPEAHLRAADLYGGELLAGHAPREPAAEEWLFHERRRLAELARRTLGRLADHQAGAGQLDAATETAQRLLAMDRLSENAHRCLMAIYRDRGQRGLALKQFEICRDLLRDELSVSPEAETERLYRAISQQRPAAELDSPIEQLETAPPPAQPSPPVIAPPPASPRRMAPLIAAMAAVIALVGFAVYQANLEGLLSERRDTVAELVEQTRSAADQAQRKAAEIAFWSLIKDSPNPADYDAYLEKYPQGDFIVLALTRVDEIERSLAAAEMAEVERRQRVAAERVLWDSIETSEDPLDYRDYLKNYPAGAFTTLAWARLDGIERDASAADMEEAERDAAGRRAAEETARREAEARAFEQAVWNTIENSMSASDYDAYLQQYPDGIFSGLARARLVEAERQAAAQEAETARRAEAEAKLEEARRIVEETAARNQALTAERALWDAIKNSASLAEYAAYLQQYPGGTFAAVVQARVAELQRQAAAQEAEAARRAQETAKLVEAERIAEQDVEIAALSPEPQETRAITEQGILRDVGLRNAIKVFYNRYPVERQRYSGVALKFRDIVDMKLWSISGNRAQIDLTYRVRGKNAQSSSSGHSRALVTVERVGSSFRVLELRRWDGTYSALAGARLGEAEHQAAADETEQAAGQEVQTAALSRPLEETLPITEQDILQDAGLKTEIKDFYDRDPVERGKIFGDRTFFDEIVEMTVIDISRNRARIDMRYRVSGVSHAMFGDHVRALVTVEKVGSSYRVLGLKRWDDVFGALSGDEERFPITEQEILQDDELKTNIREFYDSNPVERHSYSGSAYSFVNIIDMQVVSMSGSRAEIDLTYTAGRAGHASKGSARALVTVEKVGSSIRVVELKRWDGN